MGDDNWATSAVFAQEESLEQQLLFGVRGLDIRVGYYPTTDEKFWLVHGIIKTHPLTEGLQQIQNFLRNSNDIIYMSFWIFEQIWTDEAHDELFLILEKYLGQWWVLPNEKQYDITLNEIWNPSSTYLRDPIHQNEGKVMISYVSHYTFLEIAENLTYQCGLWKSRKNAITIFTEKLTFFPSNQRFLPKR